MSAQDVTFQSADNGVVVQGRFLTFDGANATVLSDDGPVTFNAQGMSCIGTGCPDLAVYVPLVRLVGEGRVANVLLPALIDVFARDKDWRVLRSDGTIQLTGETGATMTFQITPGSSEASFAAFLNHDADILMSMRELRTTELDQAHKAGLGRLDVGRQSRILALDALVPVASPSTSSRTISMQDLIAVLSGDSAEFDVHLTQAPNGQIQGFEDRFMRPSGFELAAPESVAIDRATLLDAIESQPGALSLLPFGQTGNTQPLALTGPCGLQSAARFLTLKTEDYPLTFPIFLYLPQRQQHGKVAEFLTWLRSPSAQLVIRRAGFVDLAAVPIPLAAQGDRLANAVANAGAEVSLGELQRMVRVLRPRVRMSSTFRFEPGSTRLDGQSRSNVMQLAQAIRDGRFGGRELLLVGFSDGRGPAVANRDLSAARAEAVMQDVTRALGGQVPDNVTIDTEAFGEALPMACDDTAWGQQTNRRVELWVRDAP